MIWILLPLITALGMAGGQKFKALRRFGIPLSIWYAANKVIKPITGLGALILIFIFSLGDGENSKLYKFFLKWGKTHVKTDTMVRLTVSIFLCLVLYFSFGAPLWSLAPVIVAYQLRLGGRKITDKYDFIYDDFFRFSTFALAVVKGLGG